MGRLFKFFGYFVGSVVAILIVASVAIYVLFDPNDFRDQIAAETKLKTGRELIIEGDIGLSLFPWFTISVGKSTLGNAPGFGDEPFASFSEARLSVRLLPMLLRREISVGTAELDGLHLNLVVARSGYSNWQDFDEASDAAPEVGDAGDRSAVLDVAGISIRNASIAYNDATSGDKYRITDVNLVSGRVATTAAGTATIILDDLSIDAVIEDIADVPTTFRFSTPSLAADTEQEILTLGDVEMSILGVDIHAIVEPFSYANDLTPVADIQVAAFSPRSLMQRLGIEVPETADPNALGKVIIDARARITPAAVSLTDVDMVVDDTTFTGKLSVPLETAGFYEFELLANSINLSRYMEPAAEGESSSGTAEVPVEIPVDLIRPINARGNLRIGDAYLGAIRFENVDLGLNVANGRLRIHPVTATLFGGAYNGDVRIDARSDTPVLSVNEQINGVQLGALVAAMFGREDVTGTINGSFVLSGRGDDLATIQKNLDGSLSFDLVDGAVEGIDVWHELRSARALVKQQATPEPVLPARTPFSTIHATGPVDDGVFNNADFLAELPFMQLAGQGTVDIAAATLNYRMTARVLESPEFVRGATPEELEDFTKAIIPLRVSGPLAGPSIKPDMGAMLKERAREEIKDRLFDELLGGRGDDNAEEAAADEEQTEKTPEEKIEEEIEDKIKDKLEDLFKR